MRKDELYLLHSVLYYVVRFLEQEGYLTEEDLEPYHEFEVYPGHLHKTKLQHKCAVFILAYILADVVSREGREKDRSFGKAEGLVHRIQQLLDELFETLEMRGEKVPERLVRST